MAQICWGGMCDGVEEKHMCGFQVLESEEIWLEPRVGN